MKPSAEYSYKDCGGFQSTCEGGGAKLKGVLVTNYPQQVTRKLLGPFNIRMFVPGRR